MAEHMLKMVESAPVPCASAKISPELASGLQVGNTRGEGEIVEARKTVKKIPRCLRRQEEV